MNGTAKRIFNKPTPCPWTSKQPLTFVKKNVRKMFIMSENISKSSTQFKETNNACTTRENPQADNYDNSLQFYHFLRLMELFSDVHPASLYTVMQLCKNDFVTCVSVLVSAKRMISAKNQEKSETMPSTSSQKCFQSRDVTPKSSFNIPVNPVSNVSYRRAASIQIVAETVHN